MWGSTSSHSSFVRAATVSFVIFVVLPSLIFGQNLVPSIDKPLASGTFKFNGGGNRSPIEISLLAQGADGSNCTISFSKLIRFDVNATTLLQNCSSPAGELDLATSSVVCDNLFVVDDTITLITGEIIPQDLCNGEQFTISVQCLQNTPVNGVFTASSSSAELLVDIVDSSMLGDLDMGNDTTMAQVVDYTNTTRYNLTAKVKNVGRCAASNIRCTLQVPVPLTTLNSTGVLEYLRNESIGADSCTSSLDTGLFVCPVPGSNGPTAPGGASILTTIGFLITGDGILDSSVTCTANNLGDLTHLYANQTSYVINFVGPPASSSQTINASSSSGSTLIIDVVIPLSVFGGLAIFLAIVALTTVLVFLVVKKVILKDESVGF